MKLDKYYTPSKDGTIRANGGRPPSYQFLINDELCFLSYEEWKAMKEWMKEAKKNMKPLVIYGTNGDTNKNKQT